MGKPYVIVLAGKSLFESFFGTREQRLLSRSFRWKLIDVPELTAAAKNEIAKADALISTWDSPHLDGSLPKWAPRIRVIGHCGGAVKGRFDESLFERLTVTNAAEPMARTTAELGVAFLLYAARNIDFYRGELRKASNRIYDERHLHGTGEETLLGRQVSLMGFGRVGQAIVELLRPFQIQWLVFDPHAPRSLAEKCGVRFTTLDRVLRQGSLLVLAAALTRETRGLLGRENLAKLPDGATLINIARGGLVDLAELTRQVRRKRLRCALDVSDPEEPLPIRHPLRNLPGAILTPHVGGGSAAVRREIAATVIEDLKRFFNGQPVENRVTSAMLSRMT
ncbi:MAG: hypothetical protein JO051_10510 [Acidobacteriaceae bacterium]|nr:hypothetical protein [Acidobacteriaceae bacterium]